MLTTAPLYNIIIIFDTVVRQKRDFKRAIRRVWRMSTLGNVKIALSERLLHPHVDVPYSLVVT